MSAKKPVLGDWTPPRAPWNVIKDNGSGYLSTYLSEPLARWPIREITRPGDNKSDPNIETGSYGLFSTCEPHMRRRIVLDGAATVFFMTTRKGQGRVLTGYYHMKWFSEGGRGAENKDYALAADKVRFVDPIAPATLPDWLRDILLVRFRTQKPIEAKVVSALRDFVVRVEDRTTQYLDEISRIELFSYSHSGYRYPSWGREVGFTWSDAQKFLEAPGAPQRSPNSSHTGTWRCTKCDHLIGNRALLKVCPVCSAVASLVPHEKGG